MTENLHLWLAAVLVAFASFLGCAGHDPSLDPSNAVPYRSERTHP